ncbi:MAG: AAA-like domain-containing protein, partial [Gammaproteobacteria bacterium]|nr:AAA-like domain-containing protein [Gammaproteobacteria bacterium]
MNSGLPAEEYFVAGAPLAAERACYVARPADRRLLQAIREGRSCHVFAPRLMGKTSLMLRIVPQLRDGGRMAAMIDLTQMGGREGPGDAGRWFYTFAYRIVRELRLKVPLQQWWQERVSLTASQRLVEFFRELVLGQCVGQVVIFIDDFDSIEGLAFLPDFLVSLRACLAAAATDPEFRRLVFVLLGVTTPARLAPDPSLGPFELSERVALEDFTAAETLELATGLTVDATRARALLERVHYWTGGQPYLTQKLCRALTRVEIDDGASAIVDRLVEQRLLNPAAIRGEPLLGHIATRLQDRDRRRAQLLSLYGRVRKGLRVPVEDDSPLQDRLRLLGLAVDDGRGRLRVRNRVYAAAFTTRWVNQNLPLDLRGSAFAAVLALVLIGAPLWYTQFMPREHIAAMGAPDLDEAGLLQRHRRLSAWPGHAATADRLLAAALERRAGLAEGLPDVLGARARLATLDGYAALADSLPARHWSARMQQLQRTEQRDGALLAALQAAQWGDAAAGDEAARLIGEDYPDLLATLRPPAGIQDWRFVGADELMVVGDGGRVDTYGFGGHGFEQRASLTAMALLHDSLVRTLRVDRQAPAGRVTVSLQDVDGSPDSWLAELVDPQARRWRLEFSPSSEDDDEVTWQASVDLDRMDRRGEWRLVLADSQPGRTQALGGWRLGFGDGRVASDLSEASLRLPQARWTGEAVLLPASQDRLVVAVPDGVAGAGAIVVWSLVSGAPVAYLPRPPGLEQSGLGAQGSRLLLRTGDELILVETATGHRLVTLALDAGRLVSDLALSPDERHVAWLERDGGQFSLSVLALETGEQLRQREGVGRSDAGGAVVAVSSGAQTAVIASGRRLRALDLETGRLLGEVGLDQPAVALALDPPGDWVALAGADGATAWYRLPQLGQPRQRLWTGPAGQWHDMPLQMDGAGRLATASAGGWVQLLRLSDGAALSPPLHHGARASGVRLAPQGRMLASYDNDALRLWRVETSAPRPRDTARSAVNLSPDGRDGLLGNWNGAVHVLPAQELSRGVRVAAQGIDYLGHSAPVTSVVMSPDRALVASGGADGVIRLWSTHTGEPHSPIQRQSAGPVRRQGISPPRPPRGGLGARGAP